LTFWQGADRNKKLKRLPGLVYPGSFVSYTVTVSDFEPFTGSEDRK
jgi:hypothetical protein